MRNKKFFKGIVVLTLIVMLNAMLFSGCSKKADETNSTSTEVTTAAEESSTAATEAATTDNATPDISEHVTLTWYMPVLLDPIPNEENVMTELNKITNERLNADIKFVFLPGDTYTDKIKIMATAGEEFDIFAAPAWLLPFSSTVSQGIPVGLNDLLEKYGSDVLKANPEMAWSAVTMNSEIYAIANPITYLQPRCFAFRKDLVDKYNIDYASIDTYEKLTPVLEMLKEKEPGITPYVGPVYDLSIDTGFFDLQSNIAYNKATDIFEAKINNPGFLRNAQLTSDYIKKGLMDPLPSKDAYSDFKTGNYAVVSYHLYDPTFVKITTDLGMEMVATKAQSFDYVGTSQIAPLTTMISNTSKNKERAMMLINLLFSDKKVFNTFAYGVEGEDYKVISGAGTDNPTIETNTPPTWALYHPWIGNLWMQWPSNWNSQEALDTLKEASDKAIIAPICGFIFDPENVKKEVAQLDALSPEVDVISYSSDPQAEIEKIGQKLTDAGIDTVIAEVDKQYREWKIANGK